MLNKRIKIFFIIALFISIQNICSAGVDSDLILSDFTSPVTTQARYGLLIGAVATGFLLLEGHDLDGRAKTKSSNEPPLREYGYVGEVVGWGFLNGLYTIGFATDGYVNSKKKSLERAEMMMSSSFFTLLSTTALKVAIKRTRPAFPEKRDSFPSGHSSMAFNFASLVTAEHGLWWGLPAHAVAGFVSLSRVNDGWHWISDVFAGATIGLSYGWGVYLNRRKETPRFWFSAFPGPDAKSAGFSLSYSY